MWFRALPRANSNSSQTLLRLSQKVKLTRAHVSPSRGRGGAGRRGVARRGAAWRSVAQGGTARGAGRRGWCPPVSVLKRTSTVPKYESKQIPASQADAARQANEPLPNTVREPLAGPLPSWPLRQVSLCSRARELFTQMVLWTWALLVFKATLFWGLVPQVQVLKVRGAPCGVQDLFSSGRSSRFWPWVTARAGVYGSIVSQPLLPGSTWAFSPPPTCRSHVASFFFVCFFFPDKVVPYVTVDSVCSWKGMGSVSFCVAILNVIYQCLFECGHMLYVINRMEGKSFNKEQRGDSLLSWLIDLSLCLCLILFMWW